MEDRRDAEAGCMQRQKHWRTGGMQERKDAEAGAMEDMQERCRGRMHAGKEGMRT